MSEVTVNAVFYHKFTTRFFLQKSTIYKRNHVLFNEVISVIIKFISVKTNNFIIFLTIYTLENFVLVSKQGIHIVPYFPVTG